MTRVQIIEDETLQGEADFDNCEVWLLSQRQADSVLDERLVVVQEITMSEQPSYVKFPMLMTEIYEKHPTQTARRTERLPAKNEFGMPILGEDGMPLFEEVEVELVEGTFTYEVLTRSKDNFAIHAYVCDENSIRVVSENANNTDGEMTIQTGGNDDDTGGNNAGNFNYDIPAGDNL